MLYHRQPAWSFDFEPFRGLVLRRVVLRPVGVRIVVFFLVEAVRLEGAEHCPRDKLGFLASYEWHVSLFSGPLISRDVRKCVDVQNASNSFFLLLERLVMIGRRSCIATVAAVLVVFSGWARAEQSEWAPEFYGFCMETHDSEKRSVPQQAKMLASLGFDGVGYPLWLNDDLQKNLQTLDDANLKIYQMYMRVNLAADSGKVDPKVGDAMRQLKGRPVTISVLLSGLPPADPKGMTRAVEVLRELGDLAAKNGLKISIYHHTNDWTESLLFSLDVVKKVDHPQVGVNFNLCHWLKIDGDKSYERVLRANADKVFAVTINGAQCDSDTWTDGLIQPLDAGDFDNRALLTTLRKVGYRGPIGLMCYGIQGDAKVHLGRSMKVWKEVTGQ